MSFVNLGDAHDGWLAHRQGELETIRLIGEPLDGQQTEVRKGQPFHDTSAPNPDQHSLEKFIRVRYLRTWNRDAGGQIEFEFFRA
jgi:hypothetical protein